MYCRLFPGLLLTASVAHVVTGFLHRQPALVQTSLDILKAVPVTAEALNLQAVCHVLLGATDDALAAISSSSRWGTTMKHRNIACHMQRVMT